MKLQNILSALLITLSYTTYAQSAKKDTVFLLKEKRNPGYHTVFIDINPQSKYYKAISDFSFTGDDEATYASTLKLVEGKQLTRFGSKIFPRKWIKIYQYKGKFYVYHPSDFMAHYMVRLTDSSYITYEGEGPFANKIISFDEVNSSLYRFSLKGPYIGNYNLRVHIIDPEKGIAVFEESVMGRRKDYFLMVTADKVRNLPVIVNYCPVGKEVEFNFRKPDYRKLLNMKSAKDSIK